MMAARQRQQQQRQQRPPGGLEFVDFLQLCSSFFRRQFAWLGKVLSGQGIAGDLRARKLEAQRFHQKARRGRQFGVCASKPYCIASGTTG
jgi:hypothetical protein